VAALLRTFRHAAGLSQEELAELAGLSVHAIGAIERGARRRPHPHTLRALASALSLPDPDRALLFAAAAQDLGSHGIAVATIPAPLSGLIGRGSELASLVAVLFPQARLTTLIGPAGVGKTRLALAAANQAASQSGVPAAFVPLAAVRDARMVIPAIAQALSLRESGAAGLREVLHRYLAPRRVLLVLDNFEHVLDAAPEVAAMLAAAPGVVVLATSRAPLHLTGELLYEVPPLAPAAAAQLFLERSGHTLPAGLPADTPTVAAICRRLDNMPLAIELAAARTRVLPAQALLARLDHSLDVLRGGPRDLPERQQTLRTAIGWSYGLLTAAEQALFRRLGVFRSGWGVAAAAAVGDVSAEQALDLLGGLIDNSLILRSEVEGEPRFSQLETIRAYAVEQLEASREEAASEARHTAYYRDVAISRAAELFGADQPTLLDELQLEHDNLTAACRRLLREGQVRELALMCYSLWLFWSIRGHLGEGQFWADQVLAHPGPLPPAERAKALFTSAGMLFPRGRYAEAAARLHTAADLSREEEDISTLARILGMWGFAAVFQGRGDAAALFDEARRLACRTGDPNIASLALVGLAHAAIGSGKLADADLMLARAESELRQPGGAPWSLAVALSARGRVALLMGDSGRTAELVPEAVTILARLQDVWSMVQALTNLADAAFLRSDPQHAARLYGAVDALAERSGATVFPVYREFSHHCRRAATARIGSGTFNTLHAEGAALPSEELVRLAAC
jgi:predicted ATPase/transcriptional regulator with XRE-family HTH domain